MGLLGQLFELYMDMKGEPFLKLLQIFTQTTVIVLTLFSIHMSIDMSGVYKVLCKWIKEEREKLK